MIEGWTGSFGSFNSLEVGSGLTVARTLLLAWRSRRFFTIEQKTMSFLVLLVKSIVLVGTRGIGTIGF